MCICGGRSNALVKRLLALRRSLPYPDLPTTAPPTRAVKLLTGQFGAVAGAPRAARYYVKQELLPAVGLLADDNPEFVKSFKQANRQDDRRGGQSPRPAQPPTPPPGA